MTKKLREFFALNSLAKNSFASFWLNTFARKSKSKSGKLGKNGGFFSIPGSAHFTRLSRNEIPDMKSLSGISGFTLIELLVVAALIIVLTGLSFVNFRGTSEKSRNGKRQADIAQIRSALELYRASNQTYPIYSSANKVTNFTNLLNDATFSPLLSTPGLTDPTNTAPYQYTYQSSANGFTYTVCYTSEPTAVQSCLTNP